MLRTHVLCLLLLALAMMAPASEAQTPTWSNIVYATAPTDVGGTIDLKLDIYRPASAIGPQPAALYVHGGSWFNASLTKSPLKQAAIPMYDNGLIVVAVDYRLSPNPPDTVEGRAIYPAHIHDVKAAIRFIRAHAAEYGIDPYRIGVYGNSAGGHLAAVAGTSADVPELEGTVGGNLEYSSRASAVVDFFGPTDILHEALDITIPPFSSGDAADIDGPNTYTGMLIGHLPGMKDLRDNLANPNPPYPQKALLVSQTNPMTFVDPTDPPFYIAHGTSDNIVPIKQSQRLYDALVAADVTGHVQDRVRRHARQFWVQVRNRPPRNGWSRPCGQSRSATPTATDLSMSSTCSSSRMRLARCPVSRTGTRERTSTSIAWST